MAQTGVVYVAVAAAAICAGALGFAVIWSYEPAESPAAVSPAQPPQIAAPAGKDTVPPVGSAVPSAADTETAGARPAAPRIVTTAIPGADARRSEAATARQPAKSSDPSPTRSGATAHAHTTMLEPVRAPVPTPSIDAKAAASSAAAPARTSAPAAAPAAPKSAAPVRETALDRPVKPGDVAPLVQSRHANAASPKADTVVADVPPVIRMPSAPTQIPAARAVPSERGHANMPASKLTAAAPEADARTVGAPLADPTATAEPKPAPVVVAARPVENAHANTPARKLAAIPQASEGSRAPAQAERAAPLAPLPAARIVAVAPAERGHVSAATPKLSAVAPQGETRGAGAPLADPTVTPEPKPVIAVVRPAENAHASVPARKLAAVPQASEGSRAPAQAERAAPLAPLPPARIVAVAPAERGHVSAATPKLSAVAPQGEGPAVSTALADPAPLAVVLAPVVASVAPVEQAHANAPPGKLRAAPQGSEAPRTPAKPERAAPRRLAALPPPNLVPDKPADTPIRVLRGGPFTRYAQTGRLQSAEAAPAITVIRGGRPRPSFGHPGPLILRVPH